MPRYVVTFSGRRKGAIGIFQMWRAETDAPDADAAVLSLYDRFEHIHMPAARLIPDGTPPLDDYASGEVFGGPYRTIQQQTRRD